MSDLDTGTADAQSADDIRSSLAAALEQSEGQQTGADDAGSAAAKVVPDTGGDDAAASGRARGPDGKFLKKEEGADDTAAPAAKAAKAAPTEPDPATQAAAADTKEPPAHWSQADKDKFKAQTPESQAFILDRFKAMEGDSTRKTQEIAAFRKEYGPVHEMFAPHADAMRAKGFTPRTLIEAWANVEQKLAAGPDSAIDVIKGLVGGYNISVQKLAAALGVSATPAAAAAQQDGQQPTAVENGQQVALPPEVAAELKALREQVGSFGQKFQTIEQREAAAARARELSEGEAIQNQVNEFKSAVDANGQLLHPHFDAVEDMMVSIANGYVASKQPVPPLDKLYETAVYANPETREKLLTAQRQQDEAKRVEEAKAKAASARKAGSSVTGAPGSGQAPNGKSTDGLSLREQLEAAADEAA